VKFHNKCKFFNSTPPKAVDCGASSGDKYEKQMLASPDQQIS